MDSDDSQMDFNLHCHAIRESFTTFKEFSFWALVSHKEYRCLVLHLHEDLRNDLFVADIMVELAHCYRIVQVKLQL